MHLLLYLRHPYTKHENLPHVEIMREFSYIKVVRID